MNTASAEAQSAHLPRERTHFKELLLSNHFEKELKTFGVEGPPVGDTAFEQLECIGYQPQLQQLNAIVELKQPNGYSGDVCTAGSTEYVGFYMSDDGGATWTALGVTSFTAWDVPGPQPLQFDVTLPVDLPALCCKEPNIVMIRGILSWEVPPSGPTAPIVWGNGLDVHVQVAPLTLGTFAELWECLEIPIELGQLGEVVNLDQVIEFGSKTALSPVELHKLYEKADVPQHRYLLPQVMKLLGDPAALSLASAEPNFELVAGLEGVNLGEILGVISDPQGDEQYEQLGCIGLNTSTDNLVATIDVKLSSGYSGSLCTNGSYEYVAFWADWGAGWEYAGTTAVNVHDISAIPSDGLQYAATLPFGEALTKRRPCTDGALVVPVRAVLSWATPPSSTNPYEVPVWGGHLQANVLIPPGQPVHHKGGPDLESIGSMPLDLISQSTGLATGQSLVAFYANACPFGGTIVFTGHVINSSGDVGGAGLQYRILISPNGGTTYVPMIQPFTVQTNDWLTSTMTSVIQTPDPQGWCTCLEDYAAAIDVVGNILGSYQTAGDGRLWIAMEVRQGMTPLGPASPTWTMIQLDNEAPTPVAIAITSGAGSCGDFHPGDTISGTYSAQDNEDLVGVSISVEMAMPGATLSSSISSETLTTESGTWTLQTLASTEPCGYTMVADAVDNTIVDSGYIGWNTPAYTGFCLRPLGS